MMAETKEMPLKDLEKQLQSLPVEANTEDDAKQSAENKKEIQSVLNKIKKKFGSDMIDFYDNQSARFRLSHVPTQRAVINKALGIGGIPLGKITEIYGPEHTAKTGLLLGTIAEAQKLGLNCAMVDAEWATEMDYLHLMGVDTKNLIFCRPETGEDALKVVEALVYSGEVSVIGIESVAALTPKTEMDGEIGDAHMALQARLMSQAMRKLNAVASKNRVALIFLNQIRETMNMYGEQETTPGGKALRYYASVRIELRKGQAIKNKQTVIGTGIKVNIKKNRVGIPFRRCEFDIIFGKPYDPIKDLHENTLSLWKRGGGSYSLLDENGDVLKDKEGQEYKAVGKEGVLELIRSSEELQQTLDRLWDESLNSAYSVRTDDDENETEEDADD